MGLTDTQTKLLSGFKSQLGTATPEKSKWLNSMIDKYSSMDNGSYTGVTVNPNNTVQTDYNVAKNVPSPTAPVTDQYANYKKIIGNAGNVTAPSAYDTTTGTATAYTDLISKLAKPKLNVDPNTTTNPNLANQELKTPINDPTVTSTKDPTNVVGNIAGGSGTTTPTNAGYTDTAGATGKHQDVINTIIGQIQGQEPFSYDPTTDTAYQKATKDSARKVMEIMNQRGILNSTLTANQISQMVNEMLPAYEEKAYGKYQDNKQDLYKQLSMYSELDATEYSRYIDQYNMDLDTIEAERQKISDAWYKVQQTGFVDNDTSAILGVPVGTLSAEARLAKEKREQDLQDYETELANNKAIREEEYAAKLALMQEENKMNQANAATAAKTAAEAEAKTTEEEATTNTQTEYFNQYYGDLMRTFGTQPDLAYKQVSEHPEIANYMGQENYNNLLMTLRDEAGSMKQPEEPFDYTANFEDVYENASKTMGEYPSADSKTRATDIINNSNMTPQEKATANSMLGLTDESGELILTQEELLETDFINTVGQATGYFNTAQEALAAYKEDQQKIINELMAEGYESGEAKRIYDSMYEKIQATTVSN